MKLGMSCYCLDPAMEAGRMNVDDVIDFAVAHGCEHIEFVPFHLEFVTPEKKTEYRVDRPCSGKMRQRRYRNFNLFGQWRPAENR